MTASVRFLLRACGLLVLWTTRRRQRRRLRGLDERLLVDIGLSPAQASHEAAKPFWRG